MTARRFALLAALGLGLLAGVGWLDDRRTCAALDDEAAQADRRDRALDAFLVEHCRGRDCVAVRTRGLRGCVAKVTVVAPKFDRYGEREGTFETTLGLRYSPTLGRWWLDEQLRERQVLGR